MLRSSSLSLVMAAAAAFFPAAGAPSGKQDIKSSAQSFLQNAAEGQQAEIALGELASERAAEERVKQFGTQMIEDHQKASREIRELASREGVQLPAQLASKHKHKKERFEQLSGKEFDRAYMTSMLRDHRNDVKEFEKNVQTLKNPHVQQWAEGTLPVLKQHLQKAEQIAASIGIKPVE